MRHPLLTLAAAAALGTVLVGCSSDDGGSSASDCTPGPTVEVRGSDDLQFDADAYETEAGCVEFQYINDGAIAHTLLIENVDGFKLAMGDEASGSVELEPGTYSLYCDIAGHQSAGMEADLTVS
jgi:plastocyanin